MIMTEESWHAVRNITGVTGFVGPGSRPTPLSEKEVESLDIEIKTVKRDFKTGDEIVIIDGPFKGFTATVQMVSDDLETITALVKKGRRDMFVEIKASAVELA